MMKEEKSFQEASKGLKEVQRQPGRSLLIWEANDTGVAKRGGSWR